MTDKCIHGVTARNCYSCFLDHSNSRPSGCQANCWCKTFQKSITMSDLYEAIQPLIERIERLEVLPNIKMEYHQKVFERIRIIEEHLIGKGVKKPFVCPRCNDLTDCDMCASTGLVWG